MIRAAGTAAAVAWLALLAPAASADEGHPPVYLPVAPDVATGDVVVFGPDGIVSRCRAGYDPRPVGVVGPEEFRGEGADRTAPVHVCGRVRASVDARERPVRAGDPITTSRTPGTGVRAVRAGPVIGAALEPLAGGTGRIEILVQIRWYSGDGFSAPGPDAADLAVRPTRDPRAASRGDDDTLPREEIERGIRSREIEGVLSVSGLDPESEASRLLSQHVDAMWTASESAADFAEFRQRRDEAERELARALAEVLPPGQAERVLRAYRGRRSILEERMPPMPGRGDDMDPARPADPADDGDPDPDPAPGPPRDPDEAFVAGLGYPPDVAAEFLERLPGWKRTLADLDRRARDGERVDLERARFQAGVQAEFEQLFGSGSYVRFVGRYRYLLGPERSRR